MDTPRKALSLLIALSFIWQPCSAATITVVNEDLSGPGSFVEAIGAAASGDVIDFDPGVSDIPAGDPVVAADNVSIFAAGAPSLTIHSDIGIDDRLGVGVSANSSAFTGVLSDGAGPGEVTVVDLAGGGVLVFSGANTYSGGTTVDATTGGVTLAAGASDVFGTGAVAVNGNSSGNNAVLDLDGFDQTVGSLSGDSGGIVDLDGARLRAGGEGVDSSFSGAIFDTAGGGSLIKAGEGTFSLNSGDNGFVNTFTGGVTLDAGVLNVSAGSDLGDESGRLTFNGGTLQFNNSVATARPITLAVDGVVDVFGVSEYNGYDDPQFNGLISGAGGNTYSGGTVIDGSASTVKLQAAGSSIYTAATLTGEGPSSMEAARSGFASRSPTTTRWAREL
ncbi:MAG: autotransporter-associated beta strand repeat-containing protein [Elusimicrobia bacterium]|nr:autotransporter-associated beta strand repeat-containing protein [Elusimicrobiota bacterium]